MLIEDDDDFSTARDDLGKETQKQLALGKKRYCPGSHARGGFWKPPDAALPAGALLSRLHWKERQHGGLLVCCPHLYVFFRSPPNQAFWEPRQNTG